MKCRECVEFLMAYVDGELPPEQCASFERHMEMCPPCKDYLETYKRTVAMEKALGRQTPVDPPPNVPEQLIQAILAAKEQSDGG